MSGWREHWETFPRAFQDDDFLRQVGKVWKRQPITTEQLGVLTDELLMRLELDGTERVLDLGCGNGLLSLQVAARCREVVAVDFSAPLLDVARRHHGRPNLRYVHGSMLKLGELGLPAACSRVYCYEALQHLEEWELPDLFNQLLPLLAADAVVFFGSVPDVRRKWSFYDTPAHRASYLERSRAGNEAIGTWWHPVLFQDQAARLGMSLEVLDQDARLHTSHYRMDVRLRRKG